MLVKTKANKKLFLMLRLPLIDIPLRRSNFGSSYSFDLWPIFQRLEFLVAVYDHWAFARLGSGLPLGSTNLLFIIKLFAYSFLTFGSVRSLFHFSTRILCLSLGIKPWVSPMTILCLIQLPIIFSFLTTKDVMIPFSIPLFLNRKNVSAFTGSC